MRKPHQHEKNGVRFDCSNTDCRMPFKVSNGCNDWMNPPKRRKAVHTKERIASREEQMARYLDCGPQNWDDR